MAQFTFPEKLSERLRRIAERENRSVEDVVEAMVDKQYADAEPDESPVDDPLLRMWEMADEADLTFTGEGNVIEHSREILNTEYADHLLKRTRGDDVQS